jgi:hypothetical protein
MRVHEGAVVEDSQDAYGHQVYDLLEGKDALEIVERDDGFFNVNPRCGPRYYLSVVAQEGSQSICKRRGSMCWALTFLPWRYASANYAALAEQN